ncbi:MAG: acylneuraminate cytidylyltransferase family protein [Bacteroidota bacterium]
MKNLYSVTLNNKVSVFLPCRAGSERIPNKNTKDFAGKTGGLLEIKLKQLLSSKRIDRIILSTNDPKVIEISEKLNSERIFLDLRPENLASSETTTDELIFYASKVIQDGHILWTHVTSPFINGKIYDNAIDKYFSVVKTTTFDSLMSVNRIQTFLWKDGDSINYDRKEEKWPRTQTLPIYYEVNSGFFISSHQNYVDYKDRIGKKPFLFQLESTTSFDIDWPEDFELAEMIFNRKSI